MMMEMAIVALVFAFIAGSVVYGIVVLQEKEKEETPYERKLGDMKRCIRTAVFQGLLLWSLIGAAVAAVVYGVIMQSHKAEESQEVIRQEVIPGVEDYFRD